MQVRDCDKMFAPHRPSGLAGIGFDWSSDGAVDASMGSPLGHHPRISGFLSTPLIMVAIAIPAADLDLNTKNCIIHGRKSSRSCRWRNPADRRHVKKLKHACPSWSMDHHPPSIKSRSQLSFSYNL